MKAEEMFKNLGCQKVAFSPHAGLLPIATYITMIDPMKEIEEIEIGEIIECLVDFIEFEQLLGKSVGKYEYKGYLQLKEDGNFATVVDGNHKWEAAKMQPCITMEELKAINKQLEELGWLEE